MFVVEVGCIISLILSIMPGLFGDVSQDINLRLYNIIVCIVLFITILFANFAESVAEGRGKAHAASLKKTQKDTKARVILEDGSEKEILSSQLKKGDIVLVKAGEVIPGDGTNDAPALAQANVGLAMNSGTTAAKEAANMVDLDSDPTKILEVVEIGKQLLITRGSLTTFSIANDVAKYFAIIPAMFMIAIPELSVLNIMNLTTPYSAILSALIFNAIIIPCLIPLAIKGVKYRPMSSGRMLARNMLIYGLGGIITPFVGIKIIDMIIYPVLHMLGF